jgi:hypothetical protein
MRNLLVALLALAATVAEARLIATPSHQELLDKSDLVVIAIATSTRDTEERADLPGITVTTPANKTRGFAVAGIETRFEVSAVLKGSKGLKEFVLHHYRQAIEEPTINGPMLAAFEPDKRIPHLLFLVREKDGRYAPTCGQADPAYLCIHTLR